MLAGGTSYSTIEATLCCYRDYINRWPRCFVAGRLDGLRSAHKTKAVGADSSAGSAHSGQDAAAAAGRQHALEHAETGACVEDPAQPCADAWIRTRTQPHRFERYMQSDDPDFEPRPRTWSAST
jgi:hypothetical protein